MIYCFFCDFSIDSNRSTFYKSHGVVGIFPFFLSFWWTEELLCAFNLSFTDLSLVSSIFWRIGDDQCLIHIPCYKWIFLVVNGVIDLFICFIQCTEVNKLLWAYLAELRRVHRCFPVFLLHFFQGVRDHISSVVETIESTVVKGT